MELWPEGNILPQMMLLNPGNRKTQLRMPRPFSAPGIRTDAQDALFASLARNAGYMRQLHHLLSALEQVTSDY